MTMNHSSLPRSRKNTVLPAKSKQTSQARVTTHAAEHLCACWMCSVGCQHKCMLGTVWWPIDSTQHINKSGIEDAVHPTLCSFACAVLPLCQYVHAPKHDQTSHQTFNSINTPANQPVMCWLPATPSRQEPFGFASATLVIPFFSLCCCRGPMQS